MRRLAVLFLIAEGVGTSAWWLAMLLMPDARPLFMAPNAPDATLFAFLLPDLLLYAGAALLGAYGLARERRWAWPVLCVHAGAVVYAGLYGLMLPLLSGGGWLAALFMTPPMIVLPFLLWRLRSEGLL